MMSNQNISKTNAWILFGLFTFLLSFFILSDDGKRFNFWTLSTSLLICLISFYQLFIHSKESFSLNNMFYIFIAFFFGVAPAIQFKNQVQFWGLTEYLNSSDYLKGNFIVLGIVILYGLVYNNKIRKHQNNLSVHQMAKKKELVKFRGSPSSLLIISIISFLIFLYSLDFNLALLMTRYEQFSASIPKLSDSSVNLIIKYFVRPIPIVCLFIYKLFLKDEKFNLLEFSLIVCALFANFPIGMPRFQAAALYFPIILIYFKSLRESRLINPLICLGLLIIFPLINQFRYGIPDKLDLKISSEQFIYADYDTFQNTIRVIDKDIITYGEQFIGVMLFFVPRSLWPQKPVGSGNKLASIENYEFSNISMSLFGEGYINAGYFGIILATLIIAVFNAKLDANFWNKKNHPIQFMFYLFLIGMEFFILRGDLLSSFAYTIGLMSSIYVVYRIAIKRISLKILSE